MENIFYFLRARSLWIPNNCNFLGIKDVCAFPHSGSKPLGG